MIFRLLALGCLAGLSGCTPAFIQARQPPDDVIIKARTRLTEHGIRVDPTGRQSHRLKSIIYCFKDADRQGFQWSRAFGVPAPAPAGFPMWVTNQNISSNETHAAASFVLLSKHTNKQAVVELSYRASGGNFVLVAAHLRAIHYLAK